MPVGDALSAPPVRLFDPASWQEGRTVVQFRDNELLFVDMGGRVDDGRQSKIMQQVRRGQYSGTMTAGAQKRMIRSLTLLSQAIRPRWVTNKATGRMQFFKLGIITLTVSSHRNLDAREAYKKLLAPFRKWLRYSKRCRLYVWKLELQERGQIHYHIIVPEFIHYREIRDKWNALQRDAGYLRDYTRLTKKLDPNSTDVHAVGNEKKVVKYVIKYLSKDEDAKRIKARRDLRADYVAGRISEDEYNERAAKLNERPPDAPTVNGKLWDCSENLNERYFTLMYRDALYSPILRYIQDTPGSIFCGENFCILSVDYDKPPPWLAGALPRFRSYLAWVKAGGKKFSDALFS